MTRHDPLVALQHMLDHSREAIQMVEGRRREDQEARREPESGLFSLTVNCGRTVA